MVCFNHQAGLCCWIFIPPCGFGGWGSWKSGLLDILLHSSTYSSSFSAAILSFKKASPPRRDTSPLRDLRAVQRWIRNRDFSGVWSTCVKEKTSSVYLGWRLHSKRMDLFLPEHLVEFPYNSLTLWRSCPVRLYFNELISLQRRLGRTLYVVRAIFCDVNVQSPLKAPELVICRGTLSKKRAQP